MSSSGFEKDVELSPSSPTSSDNPSSSGKMGCLPFRRSPGRRWTSRVRSKMKKLFGRKHKEEETASDSSLGRNNRPPQNDNPYAQSNADSYANNSYLSAQSSYQQPSSSPSFRTTQSGSPAGGRLGLPSGPRPGASPRQQSQNSFSSGPSQYTGASKNGSGYSDEKLGSSAGYGANRYDAGSSAYNNNRYSPQRPGGYGGFDTDSRDSTPSVPPPQYSATRPGGSWDASAGQDEYMNPDDMTEEQREDAEVRNIKQQTREVRQDSKQLLNNSITVARETLARGLATDDILVEQYERLDRVESGADAAIARARQGRDGTNMLDRLNSTPFFVPAGGSKKRLEEEQLQIAREREAKEAKEETRRNQYQRDKKYQQEMGGGDKPKLLGAGKAEKYTFEDDDGTDAQDEAEINEQIEVLAGLTGQIHVTARSIGARLDADPDQIKRITDKVVRADDKVTQINAKLNTIR